MSEEVVRAVANGVSSSEEEEEGGEVDQEVGRENLLFAPDSSDEDDDEEDVEKEIQFEDSDSDSSDGAGNVAPEEFDFMRKQEEKMVSLEDGPISSPSDNEGREEDVNKEGNGSFQRVASLSSSEGEEKAGNLEEVDGKANEQMEKTDLQSTLVESLEQTTENQLINISAGSPEDVRESPISRVESDFVPPNNIEESHSIIKDSPSNIEKSQSNIDGSDQHQNDKSSSSSSDSSPVIGKALPDTNCQI